MCLICIPKVGDDQIDSLGPTRILSMPHFLLLRMPLILSYNPESSSHSFAFNSGSFRLTVFTSSFTLTVPEVAAPYLCTFTAVSKPVRHKVLVRCHCRSLSHSFHLSCCLSSISQTPVSLRSAIKSIQSLPNAHRLLFCTSLHFLRFHHHYFFLLVSKDTCRTLAMATDYS